MIEFSDNLKKVHVLIVDDDAIMRKLIRDMMRIVGFNNVSAATDGQEALKMLETNTVDLIVCDWKMRPMDGLEFVKHVRNDDSSPHRFVPIIMLTGRGERKDVEIARDAGVTEYLIKPFSSDSLFKRIAAAIDAPRDFVLAMGYKGPDRRRSLRLPPDGTHKRATDEE